METDSACTTEDRITTPKQKKVKRKKDPNTLGLEKEISEKLGAKTDIAHNKRGEGKLIINFKNLNELQGILDKIK